MTSVFHLFFYKKDLIPLIYLFPRLDGQSVSVMLAVGGVPLDGELAHTHVECILLQRLRRIGISQVVLRGIDDIHDGALRGILEA